MKYNKVFALMFISLACLAITVISLALWQPPGEMPGPLPGSMELVSE